MSAVRWSVIVPTFNRPAALQACVAALARVRPPAGGFEIIVVNDGGVEPGPAVRATAAHGTARAARFLTFPNAGPGAARNAGAAAAAGRWLAFTDDDCAPEPEWLVAFEGALAAAPDALAGGAVINSLGDRLLPETSHRLATFVTGWLDGRAHPRFFTSNNIAVARRPFLDAGGFDARFALTGEDRELCDRWWAQRRPSLTVPDAVVYHAHALSLRAFVGQHFAYGRGACLFRHVRRGAGRPLRIEPGFYAASIRHAARGGGVRGLCLASLTVAAHAAYAAGLLHESLRRPGRATTARGHT